jgi:hypothetical protein
MGLRSQRFASALAELRMTRDDSNAVVVSTTRLEDTLAGIASVACCHIHVALPLQEKLNLNSKKPFYSRLEFMEALAAITRLFKTEVQKKAGCSSKPLYKILWRAAAPNRMEWFLNNIRLRYIVHRSKHALLPSGTASNEALHAEINNWFKQTRQIHQATLRLKFLILTMGKQLSHNSAMYRQTARQVTSGVVLARVVAQPLWSAGEWRTWCAGLSGRRITMKASVPLDVERQEQAQQVRLHVRKRPAAHDRAPAEKRRRTPYTLQRVASVRTGGTHNTVYRRPASAA